MHRRATEWPFVSDREMVVSLPRVGLVTKTGRLKKMTPPSPFQSCDLIMTENEQETYVILFIRGRDKSRDAF